MVLLRSRVARLMVLGLVGLVGLLAGCSQDCVSCSEVRA